MTFNHYHLTIFGTKWQKLRNGYQDNEYNYSFIGLNQIFVWFFLFNPNILYSERINSSLSKCYLKFVNLTYFTDTELNYQFRITVVLG